MRVGFSPAVYLITIHSKALNFRPSASERASPLLKCFSTREEDTSNNFLRPSGFFTYHSTILHGGHIVLSVFYGSQNRQRLLLYTTQIDWFL